METAQTADYALLVLIELEKRDGQSVSELATRLSLNRGVVQRIVATLHRRAMLLRGDRGRYFLGARLIAIGRDLPHELAALARPFLRELADDWQEMVVLAVPDGGDSVVIAHHNGNRSALRVEYEIGTRHSLTRGASGIAMLAHMEGTHPRTISEKDPARLDRVRADGYARTEGEIRDQMIGLAAPVLSADSGVVGSLAVVLPSLRADKIDDALTANLTDVARRLGDAYETRLGTGGASARGPMVTL